VNEVNTPPVLGPVGNKTINEKARLSFTAAATDTDVPSQTLSFSLGGSVPAGASITAGGGFIWTPTEVQGPGSYSFDVIVTDGTLTDKARLTVTVKEINTAPVISDPGNQSSATRATVSVAIPATDADRPANTLSYTASGLPPGLTINPGSGTVSGTISTSATSGSPHTVKVTVTDNGTPKLTSTTTFTWTITATNQPPVLKPPGSITAGELTKLSVAMSATDPDTTDTLSFSLGGSVPAGASITSGGGFTWTPTETQGPGSYSFDVIVTDGALTDKARVTITIKEVNTAPVVTGPGSQSSAAGATVSVAISATDSDTPANSLTYSASGLPPGLTINPTSGTVSGTISTSATSGSPHTVSVTVTDNGTPNLTDTTTFTWTTTATNEPPIGADARYQTREDVAVDLTLPASDPDGHRITVAIASGPTHGALSGNTVDLRYTPKAGYFGTDTFTYRVSDGLEAAGPYTVTIAVVEVNVAPAAADDRYELTAGITLLVATPGVLANDNDGDGDPLASEVLGPPDHGTVLLEADGSFEYRPDRDYSGEDGFTYRVIDPSGASSTGEVSISITKPVSSETRQALISQVTNRDPAGPGAADDADEIQRTLVVMDRAARAAVGEMGLPLVLLLAAVAIVLGFGRIGVMPLIRRGDRFVGVVRLYEAGAGFGLVLRDEDGEEVFFHRSAIPRRQRRKVRTGVRVEFRSLPGPYRDLITRVRPAR